MEESRRRELKMNRQIVQDKLTEFFTYYFTERDLEKTLSLVSEEVCSIGTGEVEVALCREELRALLEAEFKMVPNPVLYKVSSFSARERISGCWDCFCNMDILATIKDDARVACGMRLTAGLHIENGHILFDVLHISEASRNQNSDDFFPLKFVPEGVRPINQETQQDFLKIIDQFVPGGVVGGYVEEGFPLYVANERLLKMAGYESYQEFKEDIDDLVINSIHPDDRAFVNQSVSKILKTRDQYEIQYRMKKKDNSYFWVYDIGRLTVDENGRNAIISVIIDISEQVNAKALLEKEAAKDYLTAINNRKSGRVKIENRLGSCGRYFFFMVDLDDFKKVNDMYGHIQGDKLLRSFAVELATLFPEPNVICRVGGDEFIIFVPDYKECKQVVHQLENLSMRYRAMITENWPDADSALSIGGVCGSEYRTVDQLYKLADTMLYHVKKGKKGQLKIQYMDEECGQKIQE